MRSIQDRTFRRITNVYKTTFTKVLQVKINVFFIDIYLEKLVQKSITIMNVQELSKIINVAMLRIRNNLMLKKEQESKLKITLLQLKKKCEQNLKR